VQLTLRQLTIFSTIAQSGSTTAAAPQVPLSQSATSAALNELERALGVSLFDRVGKRLQLNDNGRALLPTALAVLDGARQIESSFGSPERALSDLRLFASTTIGNYILPALLAGFRRLSPALRLNLRIGNTFEVIAAVRDFHTDLGLIEGPCDDPDITVLSWMEDELVITAAPHHPMTQASEQAPLTTEQLTAADWLQREPGSGTRNAVERALLPHVLHLRSTLTLGSSEAIKNSAAEGLGLCCLSHCVVQDLVQAKRLRILPTRLPRLTRRFTLIHHDRKVLSAPLQRFISLCRDNGPDLSSNA
jgi:DNA-binding transcriptional LysR family regulator